MNLLRNQSGHVARSLLIGMIGLVIPAVVMIVIYKDRKIELPQQHAVSLQAQIAPRISEMRAAIKLGGKEIELFRLPGPLGQTPIYAIQINDDAIWLGTGMGLIRFNPDGVSKLYRNFSRSPNEWVRALTRVDDKLAASIMTAPGNTDGTPAGSYLFDPITESWQQIGVNSRSLAWDGDRLWALQGRTLSTISKQAGGNWRQQKVATDNRLCGQGDLTVAAGKIWIAQQQREQQTGERKPGPSWSKEAPCGVLVLDPVSGEETLYQQGHGLASNSARAIAADENEVWVAHSIKGDGLSQFSFAQQQWAPLAIATNAEAINAYDLALSPRAIWLATPDSNRPLVRLDRSSFEARNNVEAPAEHYVTAFANHNDQIWVALSKKIYDQQKSEEYRVETVFGRIRE